MRRTARRGSNRGNEFWGCSTFPACKGVVPSCSRCAAPMVRRKARRGPHAGQAFWGCLSYPRCRNTLPIDGGTTGPAALDETSKHAAGNAKAPTRSPSQKPAGPPYERTRGASRAHGVCPFSSPAPERPHGLLSRTAALIRVVDQWRLESDTPDIFDRWSTEHRSRILGYLYDRDSGRCGLCCGEIPRQELKDAHVEHIIPKDFVRFELSPRGEAHNGGYYTSRLHGMDNLQIAHPRCNRKKGDTSDIRRWRHPEMPQRVVADAVDGRVLLVPPQATHR